MARNKGQFVAKHGMSGHKLYHVWRSMVNRCHLKTSHAYEWYGARGISVCDEWRFDPRPLIEWLESNGYGPGLQLDRIDNDGDYSPDNCRVVTSCENCRNRRTTVRYKIHGEMMTSKEVEERYGIKSTTFAARVQKHGRSPEQALKNTRKPPQFEWDVDGQMMSTKQIQNEYGVPSKMFIKRVNRGWNADRAAKTPVRGYGHRVH